MYSSHQLTQRLSALIVSLSLSALLGWALWPQTTTAAHNTLSAAAVVCANQPWVVDDTTTLNDAILCYHAETGSHGTISLSQNITLTAATETITNSHGTALIIAGNGHTLSGDHTYPIFDIESGQVTIDVLTTTAGYINGNGGSMTIRSGTAVTLSNSAFLSHTATTDGGALYINLDAFVIITNTDFISNTATDGGAIFNEGNLKVTNSRLAHNTVDSEGGAIHNEYGTANIDRSTLTHNKAKYGGVIYNEDGYVTVTHSSLTYNQASNEGGVFYLYGYQSSVYSSTLSHNDADNGGAIYIYYDQDAYIGYSTLYNNTASSDGGGLYLDSTKGVVEYTDIISNSAASDGGGIYSDDAIDLRHSQILSNTAATRGGGIYQNKEGSYDSNLFRGNQATLGGGIYGRSNYPLYITDTLILSNTATTAGAGIYNYRKDDFSVTRSTIAGGQAPNGGGIYIEDGLIAVQTTAVYDNHASGDGGGIYIESAGDIDLTQSAVYSNSAGTNGGGLFTDADITAENNTFSGNSATLGAGIYNSTGRTITLTFNTIANNSGNAGSGLMNWGQAELTGNLIAENTGLGSDCFNLGTLNDNGYNLDEDNSCALTAGTSLPNTTPALENIADNGGDTWTHAIPATSPALDAGGSGSVSVDQRDTARPQLGAHDIGAYEYVAVCDTTPWLAYDSFSLNFAIDCYNQQLNGTHQITLTSGFTLTAETVTIDNSSGAKLEINGNRYTLDGNNSYRLFTVDNGLVSFDAITLTHGYHDSDGGALYINTGVAVTLSQSAVISNVANTEGGAIHIAADSTVTITQSQVISNTNARYGGAIYNQGQLSIADSYLADNQTRESGPGRDGGVIYNETPGIITIDNSTITENQADDGGAIYHEEDSFLTITHSLFTSNSAGDYGGALYLKGEASIISSTFSQNNAETEGGSIFTYADVYIGYSTIFDNYAIDYGGGIYAGEYTLTIEHTDIISNSTDGDGGGIYSEYPSIIRNSQIISNTAGNKGGGIYQEEIGYYDSSLISENTAQYGGGIFADDYNDPLYITDTQILSNTATTAGGGIYQEGRSNFYIKDSTIAGGQAPEGGGIYIEDNQININTTAVRDNHATTNGGGIYIATDGHVNLTESTLSDNSATVNGGGLFVAGTGAVTQSLIADNSATLGGGALVSGTTTLENSTIRGNSAILGGGFYVNSGVSLTLTYNTIAENNGNVGSGLYNNGTADLTGNILANNNLHNDCQNIGMLNDNGYNLNGDNSCGFTEPTSLTNTDPLLAALADNGGATESHALQATSDALDLIPAGTAGCATTITTDQRGEPRDDGFCDSGAYEAPDEVVTTTVTISFTSPATINLSWDEYLANVTQELWRSEAPHDSYQSQGEITGDSTTAVLDENNLVNYFYYVRTIGGLGDTAESNKVGVFHFTLEPGD